MATKQYDAFDAIDVVADDDEFTLWDTSAGALRNATRGQIYPAATLEEAQGAAITEGRLFTPESVGWAADAAGERANNIWRGRKLVLEARNSSIKSADGAMQVPLLANHNYSLRAVFEMQTNDGAAGGARFNFVSPNLTAYDIRIRDRATVMTGLHSATLHFSDRKVSNGTSFAADDTVLSSGTVPTYVAGVLTPVSMGGLQDRWHEWSGFISVGATGGLFVVHWAMFDSLAPEDPTFDSIMLPGSFVEVELQ